MIERTHVSKHLTLASEAYRMPFRSFAPFLLISFGLAWSILGLYVFLPESMEAIFGRLTGNHPLFYLAVYAPAIAAFTLVARTSGIAGLRLFLGRAALRHILVDRRCSPDRLVEPQRYVHKGWCCRRSDSTRKGFRWLTMSSAWTGISLRSIPAGDGSVECFRQFAMLLKVKTSRKCEYRLLGLKGHFTANRS